MGESQSRTGSVRQGIAPHIQSRFDSPLSPPSQGKELRLRTYGERQRTTQDQSSLLRRQYSISGCGASHKVKLTHTN